MHLALPATLAGVAAGILLADAGLGSAVWVAVALGGGGAAAALLVGRPAVAVPLAAVALGLVVGGWRGAMVPMPSGAGSVSGLVGRGEIQIAGRVTDDPRPRAGTQQVVLDRVVVRTGDGRTLPVDGRLLAWLPRSVAPLVSDTVVFRAAVEAPEAFDGFDYPAYLARQGIGGIARTRTASVLPASGADLARLAAELRQTLLRGLNSVIPEPEAALGAGILLGVRSSIAPQIQDAFAVAGLTHVVAISGWNIAIVAALVAAAARPLERRRGGRFSAAIAAGATVTGYVLLTGASPSVVRAALMAAAMLVARLGGSRAHAASALALAALVMLLAAPSVLWDVGFQLSGLATAGLIWFAAPLETRFAGWPAWVREPMALTLAAQLTTLPIVVGNFERLSLVSPLANIVVVPIVPLVMLACALVAPLGALDAVLHIPLISDAALFVAGGGAWLTLRAMIVAGQVAAAVPLASIPLSAPPLLAGAWYPALWWAARRMGSSEPEAPAGPVPAIPARSARGGRGASLHRLRVALATAATQIARPAVGVGALGTLLAVTALIGLPDGRLHVIALDIGQGDAILVRAPSGATLLVDGGPDPELLLRRLGERLPWWQRRIDVVLLTHPHEDHVAGLVAVLERYRVGLILEPGHEYPNPTYDRFVSLARAEPDATHALARAGQLLRLDPVSRLSIVYPSSADAAAALPDGDINNGSVVAELRSGRFSALLTGDAEMPVEEMLLARGAVGAVDLLKVGHHGSTSSTGEAFLAALQPGVALISVGADNDYGHPHAATLEHLAAVGGLEVHRTDLEGNVEVVSDGTSYRVQTAAGAGAWRRTGSVRAAAGRVRPPVASTPGSIGPWLSSGDRVCLERRSGSPFRFGGYSCAGGARRHTDTWRSTPSASAPLPGWCSSPSAEWCSPFARPLRVHPERRSGCCFLSALAGGALAAHNIAGGLSDGSFSMPGLVLASFSAGQLAVIILGAIASRDRSRAEDIEAANARPGVTPSG